MATLRSHEAESKIQLRHLSARDIDLGVEHDRLLLIDHILGHKFQFLTCYHEVLLEAIINKLVRLGANLSRVDWCMLRLQILADLPLSSLSPVGVLCKILDATLNLLRALVDSRREALGLLTQSQNFCLALNLSHLALFHRVLRESIQDVHRLLVDFRLEHELFLLLFLHDSALQVFIAPLLILDLVLHELLVRTNWVVDAAIHKLLGKRHRRHLDSFFLFKSILLCLCSFNLGLPFKGILIKPVEIFCALSLILAGLRFPLENFILILLKIMRFSQLEYFKQFTYEFPFFFEGLAVPKHLIDFVIVPFTIGSESLHSIIELDVVHIGLHFDLGKGLMAVT